MARTDPSIAPALLYAHTYPNYVLFMQGHRLQLEQLPEFAPWDAHLVEIIEQQMDEVSRSVLVNLTWDDLHAGIAVPLRCAFWFGWENVVQLKRRYDECVREAKKREEEIRIYRVANQQDEDQLGHHASN